MTKKPSRKLIFSLGLAGILIAAALGAQLAFSRQAASPAAQASPIHPVFALLDAAGENVLESGQPVSTLQTCGQCHDTSFIAENNFHSDLGMSDQVPPGRSPAGSPGIPAREVLASGMHSPTACSLQLEMSGLTWMPNPGLNLMPAAWQAVDRQPAVVWS